MLNIAQTQFYINAGEFIQQTDPGLQFRLFHYLHLPCSFCSQLVIIIKYFQGWLL